MNPITRTAAAFWRFEISMWRVVRDAVRRTPVLGRTLNTAGRAMAAAPILAVTLAALMLLTVLQFTAGATVAAAVSIAALGFTLIAGLYLEARR